MQSLQFQKSKDKRRKEEKLIYQSVDHKNLFKPPKMGVGIRLKERFQSSQQHEFRHDDSIMRDSNDLFTGATVSPNAYHSIRELNLNNISKIQSSLSINADEFLSPQQFLLLNKNP